jgi:hypothetical protein
MSGQPMVSPARPMEEGTSRASTCLCMALDRVMVLVQPSGQSLAASFLKSCTSKDT